MNWEWLIYVGIALAGLAIVALIIYFTTKSKVKDKKKDDEQEQVEQRARERGKRGEKEVASVLGDTTPGKQYVVNDLLFRDNDGKTCQIDHVLINEHGIWVIETKNMAGDIQGTDEDRIWTQTLSHGKVRNTLYNPVRQNKTHIYCLAEKIGETNMDLFQNVVVFLSGADVSGVTASHVYTIHELNCIKMLGTGVELTLDEMKSYYTKILQVKRRSDVTEKEHIKNIRRMQSQVEKGICPRCGAKLEMRDGEMRCSQYPACKFVKED